MVRLLAVFVALLVACPALAARVQLSLQTDTVQALQKVTAVVSVIDYKRSVRPPSLVVPDGLTVAYIEGRQDMRITDQGVVRIMQFIFEVQAQEVGVFQLGPADVMVDGVAETTNATTLTVTPRTASADDPAVVAFAEFSEPEVYEGQIVLYHYGLRSRLQIYRDQWVTPPMDRLQSPRDGLPRTTEYVIDDPTGAIVVKETWQPMLATAPGDLGQIAATAIVSVASANDPRDRWRMRRTENLTLISEPSPLLVKPLPPPPPGFTGLVGDFDITGTLSDTRARAGNSVTYTVAVRGNGSLEGFALPLAPERPDARFYDQATGANADVNSGVYTAAGQWQRVIVPTAPGTLEIAPIEVVSFSPSTQRYVTHRLQVPPITVRPGAEGNADLESFSAEGVAVPEQVFDNDIRPIYRTGRLHSGSSAPWITVLALLLGAPALMVYALTGADRVRERRARRPVAPVSPLARLTGVAPGTAPRLAALDAALREALLRRTGSPDILDDTLPSALAERVHAVSDALARVRYAEGAVPVGLDERVVDVIKALMADVEAS